MTDLESTTLADPYRPAIRAQKYSDGGIILRAPRSMLMLSEAQLDQLVAFVRNEPRIMRYPVCAE